VNSDYADCLNSD